MNDKFGKREPLNPKTIKDGDIVAFEWREDSNKVKKGVAWVQNDSWFYSAYNLFRDANDEGGVWWNDSLPEDKITFFEPTKQEYLLAINKLYDFGEEHHPFNLPNDVPRAMEELGSAVFDHDFYYRRLVARMESEILDLCKVRSELCNDIDEREKRYRKQIEEVQAHIKELESTIEELKKVPTEDDFVKRMVKETKKLFKHERDKAEVIRQILYKTGRTDAEEELDAWIEGKEKPLVKIENAGDVIGSGGKKIVNSINKESND